MSLPTRSCSTIARKTRRPMRPNPLIATLTAIIVFQITCKIGTRMLSPRASPSMRNLHWGTCGAHPRPRLGPGDERTAVDVESQLPPRPMPRVFHADAGPLDNDQRLDLWRCGDVEILAQQVVSVEALVNLHGSAEQAGALGAAFDILHRLNGAQQDGGGMTFPFRDHVHAVVHAIDQVNIGMARRPEHDFGPLRPPARGVRRKVMRAEVGLHFHDAANPLTATGSAHEIFAEQVPGDFNRVPVIKRARKLSHGVTLAAGGEACTNHQQIRIPEARRPKEIRNPNTEARYAAAIRRGTGLSPFRASEFGLRSAFGIRRSAFRS